MKRILGWVLCGLLALTLAGFFSAVLVRAWVMLIEKFGGTWGPVMYFGAIGVSVLIGLVRECKRGFT